MYFAQHYLECLSQASYLIGDEASGQAVVVDPRRDIDAYLVDARTHGLTIVGVINTHFHADFLAGHLEIADSTGAWIGYGAGARTEYASRPLADGERIELGDVVLEIVETPGHTPESISVLVFEHRSDDVPYGVLTGDALFIGDVGRPDLLASVGTTADQLGRQLYESVQHRLMRLPDEVRVFPAHGAGSACGKNLSTELQSTIGQQRMSNYACRPMSVDQFLEVVTEGQPAAPEYFAYDALLNRSNREVLRTSRELPALSTRAALEARDHGAVLVDTREAQDFAAGHLAGSVNIPADGRFAETAGMVLKPEQEVVVVAPPGDEREVATRLARIGFDQAVGSLAAQDSAFLEVEEDVARASRLAPGQLDDLLAGDDPPWVVDVRNAGELAAGMIPDAVHIPLAELSRRLDEVPVDRPIVAYCASGWRSSVAASFLRHRGLADASDLAGGFAAWSTLGLPTAV